MKVIKVIVPGKCPLRYDANFYKNGIYRCEQKNIKCEDLHTFPEKCPLKNDCEEEELKITPCLELLTDMLLGFETLKLFDLENGTKAEFEDEGKIYEITLKLKN